MQCQEYYTGIFDVNKDRGYQSQCISSHLIPDKYFKLLSTPLIWMLLILNTSYPHLPGTELPGFQDYTAVNLVNTVV